MKSGHDIERKYDLDFASRTALFTIGLASEARSTASFASPFICVYLRPSAVVLVFLLTAENAYRTVAGRYAEQ